MVEGDVRCVANAPERWGQLWRTSFRENLPGGHDRRHGYTSCPSIPLLHVPSALPVRTLPVPARVYLYLPPGPSSVAAINIPDQGAHSPHTLSYCWSSGIARRRIPAWKIDAYHLHLTATAAEKILHPLLFPHTIGR